METRPIRANDKNEIQDTVAMPAYKLVADPARPLMLSPGGSYSASDMTYEKACSSVHCG